MPIEAPVYPLVNMVGFIATRTRALTMRAVFSLNESIMNHKIRAVSDQKYSPRILINLKE